MIDQCPVFAVHPELEDIRGQRVAELTNLHQIVLQTRNSDTITDNTDSEI